MSFKKSRIYARKIVLSYFYIRFKYEDVKLKLNDILQIKEENQKEDNKVIFLNEKWDNLTEEEINLLKQFYEKLYSKRVDVDINKYFDFSDFEKNINDLIDNFFLKEKKEWIDKGYIFSVWSKFDVYLSEVKDIVNKYLETFKFDELDLIDRAIFMEGYIEYKEMDTPEKVIQNEMVELAKRYGDIWSPKLINAVFYRIFWK